MPTAVNTRPPSLEAFDAVTTKNPKGSERVIFKNGVLHTEGGGAALARRVRRKKTRSDADSPWQRRFSTKRHASRLG